MNPLKTTTPKHSRILRSDRYELAFSHSLVLRRGTMIVNGQQLATFLDKGDRTVSMAIDDWLPPSFVRIVVKHVALAFWAGVDAAQGRERRRRRRRYWRMKPSAPLRAYLRAWKAEHLHEFGGCDFGKTVIYSATEAASQCRVCKAWHHVALVGTGQWQHWIAEEAGTRLPFGSCDMLAREVVRVQEAHGE